MKDRIVEALRENTADYAEIRFETEDGVSLGYRKNELEQAGSSSFQGGIVRACVKGGWGHVVFDSLEDLPGRVREACRCAAMVGHEKTQLADVPAADSDMPARLKRDFRGVGLDEKLALIQRYNDIILGTPGIESSTVNYGETFRTIYFANTRGAYFREERPKVGCSFMATARDGANIQRAHDGIASATDFNVVTGLEERVQAIASRAVALLKAPKVDGGAHTVILNRRLGGVFIHEAFGHLSEADFLYENPKMRELMGIGRRIAVKDLNVVDDGSMGRTVGSISFDEEGTPSRKNYLIRDGILSSHLHSLETAAKMGEAPTGNARAVRRGLPPIVRMTNTYVENGKLSVDELFAGVERGIYACDMFGGQTALEMFTFSAGYGYRIENGKIGELVRDVVMTGNVFETLDSIDGIANDLLVEELNGGCGKGGQHPLPVTCSAPHIRIRNLVIGGQK